MEVRARSLADQQLPMEDDPWPQAGRNMTSSDLKNSQQTSQNPPRFLRKVKHEVNEMARVTCSVLRCQATKLSYLFIPAFISIFWLLICLITTRNPNVTLEDKYIKVSKIERYTYFNTAFLAMFEKDFIHT